MTPQDAPATPVVRVDGGFVEGIQPGSVRACLGVPYAAPPLGPLRWQPPQPVPPWNGIRAAQSFAPQCLQPGRPADSVYAEYAGVQPMSEDCLYLKVWSAAPNPDARWPVMVWFHGGAFLQGAGSNPVFVQGDLPGQGVILVTFNYRLGPFGFMAHAQLTSESADGSSGNYGLLDMTAALQWVHRNIAAFGGDLGRVTIFGQSAGAAGVIDMMAAHRTRGLFRQAIAQSFGIATMRTLPEAEQSGARFADRLSVPRLSDLRALDGASLLAAYLDQPNRWMPIVDGRFITEPVSDTFSQGRQQAVPLLAGWNADEGTTFPAASGSAGFDADLARRFGARAGQARQLYPAGTDDQAHRSRRELLGDGLFALGVLRTARWHARVAPTYLYHFDHMQPFRPGQRYREAEPAQELGVFHSSEYPYIFGTTGVLTRDWTDADRRMTRLMQARWLAFAKTGEPNAEGLPHWPVFDGPRPTVLRLAQYSALIDVPRRRHIEWLDV
jgi:para-nitrobenzyl esterase